MTNGPRTQRRFSGVTVALAGFALGFSPWFLFGFRLTGDTAMSQLLLRVFAGLGVFLAALALGLASRFGRLRTDGGRIELFPQGDAAVPPRLAEALRDEIPDALGFVEEQVRGPR